MKTTNAPLSPSQVTTYLDCAARWWFEQTHPKQPATGALALGRAVHAAIAHALMPGEPRPSESDVSEAAAAAAAVELAEAELRADEDVHTLQRQAGELAALFMRDAAPGLDVAAVEQPVSGMIGTAHAHGVVDIRTTAGEIIDVKTASKRPEGISSAHALQLTTYGILEQTPQARIITLTKTKIPALYSLPFTLGPDHTQYAASMFSIVAEAIDAGLHIPNRGSNLCSRKQCAFWRACQNEFGGHVRN